MSRLANKVNAGFVPTPNLVTGILAGSLTATNVTDVRLVDPCCGEGDALVGLTNGRSWLTYGNELNAERAAIAKGKLTEVTRGGLEFIRTDYQFSAMLFNPPYDGESGTRREIALLKTVAGLLVPNGLMLCIVPQPVALMDDFQRLFFRDYQDVQVRRFPDGEYEAYKQVVLFGRRLAKDDINTDTYSQTKVIKAQLSGTAFSDASLARLGAHWDRFIKDMQHLSYHHRQVMNTVKQMSLTGSVSRATVQEALDTVSRGSKADAWFTTGQLDTMVRLGNSFQPKAVAQGPAQLQAGELSFVLPSAKAGKTFQVVLPDLGEATAEAQQCGATQSKAWQLLTGKQPIAAQWRPLTALNRQGHAIQLATSGLLNGMKFTEAGTPYILKGIQVKYSTSQIESDPETKNKTEIVTEKQASQLLALNLETGKQTTYDSRNKGTYNAFVSANAGTMVKNVTALYPPKYTGNEGRFKDTLDHIRPPSKLPGRKVQGLLAAQRETAAALAYDLDSGSPAVILAGEMSVGKTLCSIAMMAAYLDIGKTDKKIVIVCPGHLVRKWRREATRALAYYGVPAYICETVTNCHDAFATPGSAVLILSKEKAKLGAPWQHAYAKNKRLIPTVVTETNPYGETVTLTRKVYRDIPTCPKCGQALMSGSNPPEPWGNERWQSKKQYHCPASDCREPLWQAIPFKNGGREPLAHYIREHYSKEYVLIADESHMFAGLTSSQSFAITDLTSGALRSVFMTGTIYGGKASSLFMLLYRSLPDFRKLYAHNEVESFVNEYGFYQTTYQNKNKDKWTSASYGNYRRDESTGRKKELPGADPRMTALLLPHTRFLKLSDLDVEMPPYQEYILPVAMDAQQTAQYRTLAGSIWSEAIRQFREGNTFYMAGVFQAMLGWLDCPEQEESFGPCGSIPSCTAPQGGWPKDRAMVDLCRAEISEGRRVLIGVSQVNRRDPIPRLTRLLEAQHIKVAALRQNTCDPDEREEWLEKQVKAGVKVVLLNPALAETGLDLIAFPTIAIYGALFSLLTLYQFIRRGWRLGQEKDVRIVFSHYEASIQEMALKLMAAKLRGLKTLQGDLIDDGLGALDLPEGDFMSTLMRLVSEKQNAGNTDQDDVTPEIAKVRLPVYVPKPLVHLAHLAEAATPSLAMAA